MNPLDWLLLASAVVAVLVGWRLGLVCGALSLFAVAFGGSLGFLLSSRLMAAADPSVVLRTAVIMLSCVIGMFLAQVLSVKPAQQAHDRVEGSSLKIVNRLGGAALTLGFAAVVTWMLATALALAPNAHVASLMRGSTVLAGLDKSVPMDAGPLFNRLESSAGLHPEQRVFTGLGLLPLPPAPVPAAWEIDPAAKSASEHSVVRILGNAECGLTLAGSGVVVAPGLVLTNAHVVAGVADPLVFGRDDIGGHPAVPVGFDPVRDTALLAVADLDAPPLPIGEDPQPMDVVAVAGYPRAGPEVVAPASVRGIVDASGSDIYGEVPANRQVLVLAGQVLPGNSGGPVLSQAGYIVGLIFAAGDFRDPAGYALSVAEITEVVSAGSEATQRVSTGDCAEQGGDD